MVTSFTRARRCSASSIVSIVSMIIGPTKLGATGGRGGALALALALVTLASCGEKKPKQRASDDQDEPAKSEASAAEATNEPISWVRARARPGAKDGVVAISLGDMHACALHADGRVMCWGNNLIDQTQPRESGRSSVLQRVRPVQVVTGATDLALSGAYSCALVSGGEVRCWGATQVTFGQGVERVSARFGTTCGFFDGRGPGCVRSNENGRLLRPGDRGESSTPGPPSGPLDPMPGLEDAMQLAIGGRHGCALSRRGEVGCWGLANYGQNGDTQEHLKPHEVAGLGRMVQLQAQYFGNCARDDRGGVWCWGCNKGGQLAVDPATTVCSGLDMSYRSKPKRLTLPPSAEIALGDNGACSRGRDGSVTCWGGRDSKEDFKEVGNSFWAASTPNFATVPIQGLKGVVELAVSTGPARVFACALTAEGRVFCWGDNSEGQLGDGGEASGAEPVEVKLP